MCYRCNNTSRLEDTKAWNTIIHLFPTFLNLSYFYSSNILMSIVRGITFLHSEKKKFFTNYNIIIIIISN